MNPNASELPTIADLQAILLTFIRPHPLATALLTQVRDAGNLVYVETNNIEPLFILQAEALSLQRYVSPLRTVASFNVGVSKSSRNFEMFNAVLDAVPGLLPSRCWFVDDRPSNISRAVEFGMQAVLCGAESGLAGVSEELRAAGVLDRNDGSMHRAVVFDVGGVLAADLWEHMYLDEGDGLISRYPRLRTIDMKGIGARLWEEFAYEPDTNGDMLARYFDRLLQEISAQTIR